MGVTGYSDADFTDEIVGMMRGATYLVADWLFYGAFLGNIDAVFAPVWALERVPALHYDARRSDYAGRLDLRLGHIGAYTHDVLGLPTQTAQSLAASALFCNMNPFGTGGSYLGRSAEQRAAVILWDIARCTYVGGCGYGRHGGSQFEGAISALYAGHAGYVRCAAGAGPTDLVDGTQYGLRGGATYVCIAELVTGMADACMHQQTLEGSFLAASTPIFASKYSLCSVFQDLQNELAEFSKICKIIMFKILQN